RLEHIRRFEQEMHLLAEQHRKDEQMILQMANGELDHGANNSTTISEPTTPPDYRDSNQSNSGTSAGDRVRSQTVPVGVSGIATPTALGRLSAGSQQLMTPPEDTLPRMRTLTSNSIGPNRRLSNEDPLLFDLKKLSLGRSESYDHTQARNTEESSYGLGQINTTKFLFGDDNSGAHSSLATLREKSRLNLTSADDKFPVLLRRESFNQVSTQAPTLSQAPTASQGSSQWSFLTRNRPNHQRKLSNIHAYPEPATQPQNDKRASVEISSTFGLFNGAGQTKPSFPASSHSRQPSQRSLPDVERRESDIRVC
ncbi:hypothetical protein V1514DRAFT_281902, partial [Lipomyces japonicus]|uniref:uncharacterized protein n=1 Tax=Lipomyces japonicus TaxID=56871 RepID=UPI0034CFF405